MALTEDLGRLMGFQSGPDNNAEVNIKIKPLGNLAQNAAGTLQPQTKPALGSQSALQGATPYASGPTSFGLGSLGGGGVGIPTTPGLPSTLQQLPGAAPETIGQPAATPANAPPNVSVVPQGQQFTKNPQLVPTPSDFIPDQTYLDEIAGFQAEYGPQIISELNEIGWVDENGNFIPGSLENEAWGAIAEQNRLRDQAIRQALEGNIVGGTVFSGRRAQRQAEASGPYDSAIAALNTALSGKLGQNYTDIAGLYAQWEAARNAAVSRAIARRAAETPVVTPPAGPPPWQTPAEYIDPNAPPPPANWPSPEGQGPWMVDRDLWVA